MKQKLRSIPLLSIVFLFICSIGAIAQTVWEYKIITQQPQLGESATKALNDLGKEGWEVVAVVPQRLENREEKNSQVSSVFIYLKRPKQ